MFATLTTALRPLLAAGIAAAALTYVNTPDAEALDLGSSSSTAGCTTTAASTHGWGTAEHYDGFSSLSNWSAYDGAGHDGNGRRSPSAVSISDGALTITSTIDGTSGGVTPKWGGRKYGRWEICSRATVASPTWHAVALLWPDAEDWPVGGEVDFMEIADATRSTVQYNLHYGAANNVESHTTWGDATNWHAWAVEWTPQYIAVYRDGVQWARSTDVNRLPPRSMHLALQLDNFGGLTFPTGQMFVDWVAEYGI
ncbi:glycoside hydrolase family 16 protein [Gordonia desulfuricans]|uniref:Glycoside hydrolase family 16 protein n=1 Tax=Gordonia desulfuricans TaxID=89051 RepID=A0A7K3LPH2_9ACTN|nr:MULTISPECIES: glycoside hydrolase family 16 protein [Gordonia]NDK90066.1 glycoside hydrolase family 16 protein [Gordonia desulfuricans]WLP92160.1 glycoside hydrolase family 16 protein [Gordonia sp. NB41Y]